MKGIRTLKLLNHVALCTLALCFSAGLGKAQSYQGKFTLPFEARWGSAVLPAGDYTFTVPSATRAPFFLYLRGGGKTAIIHALVADPQEVSDHSRLTVVNTGGSQVIRTLEAGEVGLTFVYAVPKAARRQLAQNHQGLRHVAVSAAGD